MLRLAIGLILISVPFLELLVLIKVGQAIGAWATVALVLGTGLAGAWVISRQSLGVVRNALEAAGEGRPPVAPVLDGLFLMLAGVLLLTPGLMTDVVALILLVPPIRRAVALWTVRRLMQSGRVIVDIRSERSQHPHPSAGPIIEGEFTRVEDPPRHPPDDRRRLP